MKIDFRVSVDNFEDAALIESVLKKNEIKFSVKIDHENVTNSRKKERKARQPRISPMTQKEIQQVEKLFDGNPDLSISQVKEKYKLAGSLSHLDRIRRREHKLSTKH